MGIVAGISREIGLFEAIDEKIGQTGRNVSCGEAVLAMVLNVLGFSNRALYLMPDYLKNKPVDLLIRVNLKSDDFNDDIMGLALLVFALVERQLRLALKQTNQTIPDQKRKPTSTPTLCRVFQTCEGLDVLPILVDGCIVIRNMLNLRPVHKQIIHLLGPQLQKCNFFDG